jgi:hypothetical protein
MDNFLNKSDMNHIDNFWDKLDMNHTRNFWDKSFYRKKKARTKKRKNRWGNGEIKGENKSRTQEHARFIGDVHGRRGISTRLSSPMDDHGVGRGALLRAPWPSSTSSLPSAAVVRIRRRESRIQEGRQERADWRRMKIGRGQFGGDMQCACTGWVENKVSLSMLSAIGVGRCTSAGLKMQTVPHESPTCDRWLR